MPWSWEGDKKKKPSVGILSEEKSDTLLPLSLSGSTNSSFSPHPSVFPHSLSPPSLTPGLLFCRSSNFSFHLSASASLMPTMSWSVWMWVAFRMIVPAHYVRLISPRCRTQAAEAHFEHSLPSNSAYVAPHNGNRQGPVDADIHITNWQ